MTKLISTKSGSLHVYGPDSENNPSTPEVQNRTDVEALCASPGIQSRLKTARDFLTHGKAFGVTFAITKKNWKTRHLDSAPWVRTDNRPRPLDTLIPGSKQAHLEVAGYLAAGDWDSIHRIVRFRQLGNQSRIDGDLGDGHSLIMRAAQQGQQGIINLIATTNDLDSPEEDKRLKTEAFNAQNREGKTAFWLAAAKGNIECCNALLGVDGIDPEITDLGKCTILHAAAGEGRGELLQFFADMQDSPKKDAILKLKDATNDEGSTPLHSAVHSRRIDAVKALLDMDADINGKDSAGRNALEIAIAEDYDELWGVLGEAGADFEEACINQLPEFIKNGGSAKSLEEIILSFPEFIGQEFDDGFGNRRSLIDFATRYGRDDLVDVLNGRGVPEEGSEYSSDDAEQQYSSDQIRDYQKTLGVESSATTAEIKKAYYKESLKKHPDKEGGSVEEFQKLGEAYEALMNVKTR